MKIKKTAKADFHTANRLNGQKATASYGVFRGEGELVGFATKTNFGLWDAYYIETGERVLGYSCSSLKQLKEKLAAI